jgi:hypothetical protein
MKMAASAFSMNNINLNVVPDAQYEVWHPTFITKNRPFTINDYIMLHDPTSAVVAKGMLTPCNKGLLAHRSNAEAINDYLAFSI